MMRHWVMGLALVGLVAGAANAQLPGGMRMPGLPNVAGASMGNVTGVVSYCMKNKLLGGTDASSVLGTLSGKPEVKQSPDYTQGVAGMLNSGSGKPLSLDSLPPQVKTQVCDMALKQAKSFL